MARLYTISNGSVALVAATAKTVIEVSAGASTDAVLTTASITFDASAAAAGIKIELIKFSTTGTGTTFTPVKKNGQAQNLASICTAKINDTVEPGTVTVLETYFVPNTAGIFYQLPLGRENYLLPSSNLGLRVTSAAIVNVAVNLDFEE